MKSLCLLALFVSSGIAQVVPDIYIVELTGPPGIEFASKDSRRAVSSERMARIRTDQAAARRMVEARQGEVITGIEMVANALIVRIPDSSAPGLAALPGVARVYPVMEMHIELDRVQNLHRVSDALQRLGGNGAAGLGVKIGIIDTGIDNQHPGFKDDSLPMPAGFPKINRESDIKFTSRKIIVARRYASLFGNPDEPADLEGHGTAVAMVAAGVPHQAPHAFISGIAPKAYLGNYCVAAGQGRLLDSSAILKALDDAVADGMDVVNMSLGSEPIARTVDDPLVQAVERAGQAGVIVVKSAGNSGPDPNTLTSPGTAPSAVTVAATLNDRTFASGVTLGDGASFFSLAGNGPVPPSAIEGALYDVARIDPLGVACEPLQGGALGGKIALVLRGACNFSVKIRNVEQAGAAAALVYSDEARPDAGAMNVEDARLPAMMVSHADGLAIKRLLSENPEGRATLRFEGHAFAINPNRFASFSSRGPTGENGIKPDISAVGYAVYTAAQKDFPGGAVYGERGYAEVDGTSFASPIVAGAVAVVRAARPGLTADQYRSLIVHSASQFPLAPSEIGAVQTAGAGFLDLDAALRSTVAVAPHSLSFGVGGSSLDVVREFRLTNLAGTAETYTITVESREGAPGPALSTNQIDLPPGGTAAMSLRWNAADLSGGEHQGFLRVRGSRTEVDARIPYWYAVAGDTPKFLTFIQPPSSGRPGSTQRLFLRVSDSAGLSLYSPELKVTAAEGGGEVISVDSIDSTFPGVYLVRLRLGTEAVANTFHFEAGGLSRQLQISAE